MFFDRVFALFTFFFLDEKEPKNQDKPDPSGRFAGPFRAWAFTVPATIVIQRYLKLKEDPSASLRMTGRKWLQAKTTGKRSINKKH